VTGVSGYIYTAEFQRFFSTVQPVSWTCGKYLRWGKIGCSPQKVASNLSHLGVKGTKPGRETTGLEASTIGGDDILVLEFRGRDCTAYLRSWSRLSPCHSVACVVRK